MYIKTKITVQQQQTLRIMDLPINRIMENQKGLKKYLRYTAARKVKLALKREYIKARAMFDISIPYTTY